MEKSDRCMVVNCWVRGRSLVVCYPELFRICHYKEACLEDSMQFTNEVLH